VFKYTYIEKKCEFLGWGVVGDFDLANFGVALFRGHFKLKLILVLQLYSFLFRFWYKWMYARLLFIIFRQDIRVVFRYIYKEKYTGAS
jgi:hypothetical protein